MKTLTDNTSDYLIYNLLYEEVTKGLSNPHNVRKLTNQIERYMDKWSDLLASTDIHERLLFSDYDKDIIYEVTGVSKKEVVNAVNRSQVIKDNWQVARNPYYVLSTLMLRFFKVKKMEKEFALTSIYMCFPMYASGLFSSFRVPPNKDIMDYTINGLSNKFIIKQTGSIYAMLEYTITSALDSKFKVLLDDLDDENLKDIIYGFEHRIGTNIKNIAKQFYENHANEKYLFKEQDSHEEDNYHMADNNSYLIDRIGKATTLAILTEGFDDKNIAYAARNNNASDKKLSIIMNKIIEIEKENISPLVEDIMSVYLYRGGDAQRIRTINFLIDALKIYKSNSKDDNIERIKGILENWINEILKIYGNTLISKGKTTMDSYKRAIYTVLVLKIMQVVKK